MAAHGVNRVRWQGTARSYSEGRGLLQLPGDTVLVHRSRPRWLLMQCPCGCGQEVSLNVDASAGPAWRFYRRRGRLSVFPSVWRESGCKSHFIIWRDSIDWVSADWTLPDEDVDSALQTLVLEALTNKPQSYVDLADMIDHIPWDVLRACRALVAGGLASEGTDAGRGRFKREERK